MKYYDDLQRFKDKTHNDALNLQDLSSQESHKVSGTWSIISQLKRPENKDDQLLARGGSVSDAIPDMVSPDAFDAHHAIAPGSVRPVATHSAPSSQFALFQSVASAMPAGLPPAQAVGSERLFTPTPAASPVSEHLFTPVSVAVPASAHSATPFVSQEAAPFVPSSQPMTSSLFTTPTSRATTHSPDGFARMFSARSAEQPGAVAPVGKDLPLQPLLEKIATCR